ncbi:UNVERIFIED_CONTAM: hypothetical protein Sindi_0074500 [Sesamum indicum]
MAPVSAGGVEVGREGVGAEAPIPPGGAIVAGLPPEYAQIFQMAFSRPKRSYLHRRTHPLQCPAPIAPTIDLEDVMNLVNCIPENRLKYVVSLFVVNALIWWRSVKRGYEPREITWAEFQKNLMINTDPRCTRDKKRMEFLNLVQGDEQTVAEYELCFVALAKYDTKGASPEVALILLKATISGLCTFMKWNVG